MMKKRIFILAICLCMVSSAMVLVSAEDDSADRIDTTNWIDATIKVEDMPAETNCSVSFVLVEDLKTLHNGARYRHTVRDVLAVENIQITNVGQEFHFNKTFTPNAQWIKEDLRVVVFVQSLSKERKNMNNDPQRQYDSYEVMQSTIDPMTKTLQNTGTQRRVLGECFTATWCGYCPGSVGAHDRIVADSNYFPDHYTLLEWHPTSDAYGTAETDARFAYYNWGGAIPFSVFDGVIGHIGGSGNANNTGIDATYKGYIDSRKNIASPLSIETKGYVYFNHEPAVHFDDVPSGLVRGNTHINWTATDTDVGDELTIKLEYGRNGGWSVIESDLDNTGSYIWDTTQAVDQTDYKLKITVTDAGGKTASATMDTTFEIDNDLPPVVTLNTPLGGEIWSGLNTITWTATDDGEDGDVLPDNDASEDLTIDLHFTRDPDNRAEPEFHVIYTGLENTGSYEWDTNTTATWNTDTYRVRITARDPMGQETTYLSLSVFEIQNEKNYRDVDNDNMPDEWEELYPLVIVGENDAYDDPDSDGLKNIEEFQFSTDPGDEDTDSDAMPDGWEVDCELDPLASDANGDKDSDGLTNLQEYQVGTFANEWDSEGDGIPDGWEVDNGLIPMGFDADNDDDEDDLKNIEEYLNNTNPNENDTDSDGMPDGWEVEVNLDPLDDSDSSEDPDGDALTNKREFQVGTNPFNSDSDNDVMTDGWEVDYEFNPLMGNDAANDPDSDFMTNVEEFLNGTNPLKPDTDGDQMEDGWEVQQGLNPLDFADASLDNDNDDLSNLEEFAEDLDPFNNDTDGDQMPDGWEVKYNLDAKNSKDFDDDDDDDGLTNLEEYRRGLDPTVFDNPDADSDDDQPPADDDTNVGDDGNDKGSGGSSMIMVIIIIVIVLLLIIGVVVAVMIARSGNKKDDVETLSDEETGGEDMSQNQQDEYERLYGNL